MKLKIIVFVLVALAISGGIAWVVGQHSSAPSNVAASGGRKALYYTCAMHPWVRESKPGPCPVCGMNLTPVYGNEGATTTESNTASGIVTLEPESISTINVQTDLVERQPVRHTLHLAGEITGNSATAAWFEFTAYERDLPWLKIGQTLDVVVSSEPDKTYPAQIRLRGIKPFADKDFDMMSGSTTVRAEISNPPVEPGDFGKNKLFNGLHAEAHLVCETEPTLAIPRSAVISRGLGPMVYVDQGDGQYAPRRVSLGRVGNDLVEVLGGLQAGERVVTTGNVLIDSEAQLTAGQ
jgi:multidrug efflux pump subunit AcrA (membrane-fusion protein)